MSGKIWSQGVLIRIGLRAVELDDTGADFIRQYD